MMEDRLSNELKSFQSLWHGGYYEGNPLFPLLAACATFHLRESLSTQPTSIQNSGKGAIASGWLPTMKNTTGQCPCRIP